MLAGTLLIARTSAGRDPVFTQIDSVVKTLSALSGLTEQHNVSYGRMNKGQLHRFLSKRIKKTLKPDEIHADELALKMFGLVPESFDLKKSTIDLLTEQAAAFYDYDEKKLFLLENSSFSDQVETLAHELSHALADQHFDLEKYMDDTSTDDDANLARTAVVEGQATWLMLAYSLQRSGQPPEPTPKMLNDAFGGDAASSAGFPILKASPLYIQQSLLFPYSQGVLFFSAVYEQLGPRAFSRVFTDPPADSAQILHPDLYLSHTGPSNPALPNLPGDSKLAEITSGPLGEFDHQILLWQYFDETRAKTLAPHLRGSRFRIFTPLNAPKPVLEYASQWETPQTAGQFFASYHHILQAKWKGCDISTAAPAMLAGEGDTGYFVTRWNGNTVTSIEGLSDPVLWSRLKTAFPVPAGQN